jgi:putative ABC transport system permease protein
MYHARADRIYRLNQLWVEFGQKNFHFSTPFPLADAIRKDITGVEQVTKVHHPFNNIIEVSGNKKFKQDHVMMTDPQFFDVFDVGVLQGNPREVLSRPYQAILTESTAKKFFGNDNPIGKIFKYNDEYNITVGALIKDFRQMKNICKPKLRIMARYQVAVHSLFCQLAQSQVIV